MLVEVSGKRISFPRHCLCCGRHPDTEIPVSASRSRGKKVIHTTTMTWRVPYCSACTRHVATWDAGSSALNGGLAVGIIGGIVLLFVAPPLGVLTFIGGLVAGFVMRSNKRALAKSQCSPECAAVERAASYLGWSGTLESFFFASRPYAALFLEANASKLVNLRPEARQLLDWSLGQKRARLEAEHAQVLAQAESQLATARAAREEAEQQLFLAREDAEYAKWVGRIEAAKGPAGRRTALETGLRTLTQQHLRERLTLEASRIEVQAALDKADSLKSPAAKLRTLQAALDGIRNDPVPDELQAQQIKWLEDAIADVERERTKTG